MSKKNETPSTGVAKPATSELGEELGISQSFPVSSYETFAYGVDFQKMSQDGGTFMLGRSPNAVPVEKLIEMRRRDSQTRMLLRMFTLPILSCLDEGEWIMPEDTEGGEKETEFANNMFRLPPHAGGMETSLSLVLRQTLLSLVEGFSVFEEVRTVPKYGPLKGKITLADLAHRNASTIKFLVDDHGRFKGVMQEAYRPDGEKITVGIPKNQVIRHAYAEEENALYGVSMFESAWYNYDVKSKMYYVAHVAAQMAAVPGRMGVTPQHATNTQKQAFSKALRDFAFNNSMLLPQGFDVKPFTSSTGFNFLEYIDHHAKQQAKSVLLQFADSDRRLAVIENGGEDASADFFVQSLEAIMHDIAEVWSLQLMPKYIDWNFGTGKYPKWRFGALTDSARDTITEVFKSIVTSSFLNCTPEFMRETEEKLAKRLGLDIDYEEIRKREEEVAQQQADIAVAEAEAQASQPPPQPPEQSGGGEGQEGPPSGSQQSGGPPQQPSGGSQQDSEGSEAQTGQQGPVLDLSVQDSVDDLVKMAQDLMSSTQFLPTEGPDPEFGQD